MRSLPLLHHLLLLLCLCLFPPFGSAQPATRDQDKLIQTFISLLELQTQVDPTLRKAAKKAALSITNSSKLDHQDRCINILELEQQILLTTSHQVLQSALVLEAKERFPDTNYTALRRRLLYYIEAVVYHRSGN